MAFAQDKLRRSSFDFIALRPRTTAHAVTFNRFETVSSLAPRNGHPTMFNDADRKHMARALELAERGLYTTTPNPRVGCVLVRDGDIVGEGWHERAGEPHAETLAMR